MYNKKLILESGEVFRGKGFGVDKDVEGEIIFHTGSTDYQQVISDPSYSGQLVCMTYPSIGNYGINRDDYESINPSIGGLIIKDLCDFPSNFRSQMTLEEYFNLKKLSGIYDIDTRKLTVILRNKGILRAKLVDINTDEQSIVQELKTKKTPLPQVEKISTKTPYINPNQGLKVVLLDLGTNLGTIRELSKRQCDITVVPHHTTAEEILMMKPDGIILSNGADKPTEIPHTYETVKQLLGKVPILGVNLGHLILGLACGAKISRLKSGHHGGIPVIALDTKKVYITDQNHSYVLDQESLKNTDLEETYIALNDKSNQGIRHKKLPCFSVQFHPESKDVNHIFDEFMEMMERYK